MTDRPSKLFSALLVFCTVFLQLWFADAGEGVKATSSPSCQFFGKDACQSAEAASLVQVQRATPSRSATPHYAYHDSATPLKQAAPARSPTPVKRATPARSSAQSRSPAPSRSSRSCQLPKDGTWAEVRLMGLPPFEMAVRKEGLEDPLSDEIREKGYWEMSDMSVLGKPGVALDIGGHIGFYTFAMANAGWHVTTFEPMERNLAFINATLCENPQLAKRVNLLPVGLGAENKECEMRVMAGNIGNGFVRCHGDRNIEAIFDKEKDDPVFSTTGTFQIRRLQDVLKEQRIKHIDVVKLDVEGYQCEVFRGAGGDADPEQYDLDVVSGGDDFLKTYRPRLIKTEVWRDLERCKSPQLLSMFERSNYRIGDEKDPACEQTDQSLAHTAEWGHFYFCRNK